MNATTRLDSGYRFDPADPELIRNPYRPYYEHLRAAPGLHKASTEYYVASRHADVREVITNHAAFGQGNFVHNIPLYYGQGFDVMAHSSYRWLSEVFVMQDPPAHTRLRKLVAFALTPKRVAAMQPRIQQIVDGLIDAMVAKRDIELLWDFAYQLPTLVMCDMLGLEGEERSPESLARLTRAVAESFIGFETRALEPELLAQAWEAGIVSVVSFRDSLATVLLAIMAASLRRRTHSSRAPSSDSSGTLRLVGEPPSNPS